MGEVGSVQVQEREEQELAEEQAYWDVLKVQVQHLEEWGSGRCPALAEHRAHAVHRLV